MSIERIQCHVHGDQQRTYVCQHIAAEYEGEEDAVKKHRPRKDRREAVEERKLSNPNLGKGHGAFGDVLSTHPRS